MYDWEADYLATREWAASAEDILWRRSKLGLHTPGGTAERLAAWLGRENVTSQSLMAEP